jgi:hypothetical protein
LSAQAVPGIEPSDTAAAISLLPSSDPLHNLQVILRADRAASRSNENIAISLNVLRGRDNVGETAIGSRGLQLVSS